jgi:hypothetical protein
VFFAGVFEGGFRKTGSLSVVFGGEFVVVWWWDVVFERRIFGGRKMRQLLKIFLWKS